MQKKVKYMYIGSKEGDLWSVSVKKKKRKDIKYV